MSTLVFPTLPGQGFPKKSPEWLALIQGAASGAETRVSLWSYPRWHWDLPIDLARDNALAELRAVLNLYNSCHGQASSFLFSDPDDCQVTGQSLGAGDGVTTTFQLVRAFGGIGGFVEPIWAPANVATVYLNGVAQPAAGWSASAWGSATPGLVTFTAAPAAGAAVTADFSFYFPCRFEDEQLSLEKFAYQMWQAKSIKFQSIKLGA